MKKIQNLYDTKDVVVCCVIRTGGVATIEGDVNRLQAILNELVSTVLHAGRNSYFHSNTDLRR